MRTDVEVAPRRTVVMRNGVMSDTGEQYRLWLHRTEDRDATDGFRNPGGTALAYLEVWVPYGRAEDDNLTALARSFYGIAEGTRE